LPEVQQMQAKIIVFEERKKALPAAPEKRMSAAEIAEVEAAKEKSRAKFDTNSVENSYKPAFCQRFRDELAKYDYLYHLVRDKKIRLVDQDQAWMTAFEATDHFKLRYKRRYDMFDEMYSRREATA
jgi:hypothetical protein